MRSRPGAERFVDSPCDGVEAVGRGQGHGRSFGALIAPGKGDWTLLEGLVAPA